MAPFGQVEIDRLDLKQFQRTVRRSTDTNLPKRIGLANKSIGRLVIDRLQPKPDPAAIGEGAGASVRPSASKREVLLRVGGAHRAGRTPEMRWGKRAGRPIRQQAPPRPYIRQTVEDNRDEIEQAWLQAISRAMDPAFNDTDP